MKPEEKLFLLTLAILGVGLALIAAGLGFTTKTSFVVCGALVFVAALQGLKELWRGRR
jgi:hypothetical protein